MKELYQNELSEYEERLGSWNKTIRENRIGFIQYEKTLHLASIILIPILASVLILLLPFQAGWSMSVREWFSENPFFGSILFIAILIGCLDAAYKEGREQGRVE